MSTALLDYLRTRFREGHQNLFRMVEGLTEEQWEWRPTPAAHNIAFQVWHTARQADYVQEKIAGLAPELTQRLGPAGQIWTAEGLARKWNLDPASLGEGESGFGMQDAVAASLRLPPKPVVLDYTQRACAAADRAVAALSDDYLLTRTMREWAGELPVAAYLVEYLLHDEWVLGTIAALRRAQGLPRVLA
jgi:hypothetical protein